MENQTQRSNSSEIDQAGADHILLDALASLNQISTAINRIGPTERVSMAATLRLVTDSAIKVIPGSSAVIYTFNQDEKAFDPASRVSAGERSISMPNDIPRPNGMGMRAISRQRRVLSYEEGGSSIHPAKASAGAQAVVCFPLVVARQVVGALYVYLHEYQQFTQLELLMLDNFVNQAAMAIYHTRRLASMQRHLARKEDELNRMRRAGLLITSRLRLKETLEAILQMAMEVTSAQYGVFRLVDKTGRNLISHAIAGESLNRPLMDALPIEDSSVTGWVALHRQPVCIEDRRAEPWARIYRPLDPKLELRSELAVPLIGTGGRLEGVLNLESPLIGAFNAEDSHLLQALATQAVIAIQEVRLLDALQEVAQRLLAEPRHQVLNRLADLACDLLDAADGAIWTLRGDQLIVQVASEGFQHGDCLPLHGSLVGQTIIDRSPVAIGNVRIDPRFSRPDLARTHNWAGALIVPLVAGDDHEPVGAFGAFSDVSTDGRFAESEWNVKVLTCLAHYAALAVQNAARQDALRAAQEQRVVAEAFAAVGDVAANMLHHLNNKVGTIPVRVQGIQDKCQSVVATYPYLAANLKEIERSAVEAMQALRESLSHLHPIHPAKVDIVACAMAAAQSANLPMGTHVELDELDDLPPVVAGEQSLILAFTNLLENAADAMEGDGVISIRGDSRDDWVEISVSDNGPGIAPELQNRVFDFNFSGSGSATRGKLGFGLWWVKTLTVRLGGSIRVESDGCNGTTFRLRFPRAGVES
jgi:signal transduction histidine kinase